MGREERTRLCETEGGSDARLFTARTEERGEKRFPGPRPTLLRSKFTQPLGNSHRPCTTPCTKTNAAHPHRPLGRGGGPSRCTDGRAVVVVVVAAYFAAPARAAATHLDPHPRLPDVRYCGYGSTQCQDRDAQGERGRGSSSTSAIDALNLATTPACSLTTRHAKHIQKTPPGCPRHEARQSVRQAGQAYPPSR